jgi:beta-lactamase class A
MRVRRTTAAAVSVAAVLAGCANGPHRPLQTAGEAATATAATSKTATGTAATSPVHSRADAARPHTPNAAAVRAEAASQLVKIIKSQPAGAVSVAARNMVTGAEYKAGAKSGMWMASSYKLLVLCALLMQDAALTSDEMATATRAIENSDNIAGYSLFLDAGGNTGTGLALRRLGMAHTVMGASDPTFTTTSASDYLTLLGALVTPGPLSPASRSLVLSLMRGVEADQRWGVGVVADRGSQFANKNGWLSIDDTNDADEDDDDLWVANSAGVLTVAHQQVLIAIFTRHQQSFAAGVALVQQLARSLVSTVSPKA